jgi:hypothetical protein
MENKVLVISAAELIEHLQPILLKIEKMEALLQIRNSSQKATFSDSEAAEFLHCSTKKLQTLRNSRKIGFIRENGGRKILYKAEHLIEYLESNELKRKNK